MYSTKVGIYGFYYRETGGSGDLTKDECDLFCLKYNQSIMSVEELDSPFMGYHKPPRYETLLTWREWFRRNIEHLERKLK